MVKKIVVFLEDKPDKELEKLEKVLIEEGFDTWDFNDPEEFMEYVTDGLKYDVAIIDLEYRNSKCYDGEDIINKLKKLHPDRAVICRSAYASNYYKPYNANSMILKRKDSTSIALDKIIRVL